MEKLYQLLTKPKASVTHAVRAKYYVLNGIAVLASVQKFSVPKFKEAGWEQCRDKEELFTRLEYAADTAENEASTEPLLADIKRATRRAKIMAFDFIMANPDLDTFVTFTYAPEKVSDKSSYEDCYQVLKNWLSNRVQRNDLKYVLVPERTKVGDIHFHAIMNSSALQLTRALSPKGIKLHHNGKPLYNVTDWSAGFTSAEIIGNADGDRIAVSKYIFKYMGKQMGQKIGGRYVLTGGKLARPLYAYGESETEFFEMGDEKYSRENVISCAELTYQEWNFL